MVAQSIFLKIFHLTEDRFFLGLPLLDFVETVVQHMELDRHEETLRVISDLIDFFHFVDINGDNTLQWEEFVSFIVDQVVLEKENTTQENFSPIADVQLQVK